MVRRSYINRAVQRKRLLGRELQDYGAQLESHRENENALMNKKESPAR